MPDELQLADVERSLYNSSCMMGERVLLPLLPTTYRPLFLGVISPTSETLTPILFKTAFAGFTLVGATATMRLPELISFKGSNPSARQICLVSSSTGMFSEKTLSLIHI